MCATPRATDALLFLRVEFPSIISPLEVTLLNGISLDFQSDSQLGRGVAKEYAHAASCAGRPFLPIYLICDLEANIERIASTDRVNSGTIKLIDADVLKDIRSRCQLFFFDGLAGLVVDSTKAPPLETAQKIVDMIKGLSWEDFRI